MALATLRVLEGSGDPGTGFTVDLQYDDALLRLTEVDINNNLTVNGQPASVFCMVVRDSDGRIYSRTFGQGQTTLSIPTGGAGRITVTLNSRGRLDGYSFGATYPV